MLKAIVAILLLSGGIIAGYSETARALDKAGMLALYRDAESSFRQANDLVPTNPRKAGDLFLKAALSFERIAREGGIENGRLYYNLGNIHFRLGDLGRAILNYRRAERFIPHDANLQQNLAYARSRCPDKIEAKPETKVLQTLFFWRYDLSLPVRAGLFLLFFNLIWLLSGVYLFRKKPGIRSGVVACAVVSLLLAGSLAADAYEQARTRAGVVTVKEVVARKGDGVVFEPSFKEPLHAGTEFIVLEERRGWYHIELSDGRLCWIPDSAGEII